MLCEIICDQFHQKRITFDNGLNVVLGTNSGDNSIGKSTFLLIVDFVFGGNTYSADSDIIKEVGRHRICFQFEFNGMLFYFARYNTDSNTVWECDEQYHEIREIPNAEYCAWLAKQYGIDLFKLSFRDSVGRYIRVYGKENFDEHHPLHVVPTEPVQDAIVALLKLFDRYRIIVDLEDSAKDAKDVRSTFTKAQKHNFVTKIGTREYNRNAKEIPLLDAEIRKIADSLDHGLTDVEAEATEEAIRVKKELSRLKRARNRVANQLKILDENAGYPFAQTSEAYAELQKFFPGVDLKHIEEVEAFHGKIAFILKEEIADARAKLKKEFLDWDAAVSECEGYLRQLIHNPNLSKIVLERYTTALRTLEQKKAENEAYEMAQALKAAEHTANENLQKVKTEQLAILGDTLNREMKQINRTIYDVEMSSPIIAFNETNYHFITPSDKGTGTAYKGLIVFDLAVAHLTPLPILVHDSVVLKQISDIAIENILEQYMSCGKQVIIALDKQDSYSPKTASLLEDHAKLRLAPGGEELFGRSWAIKNAKNSMN